jgi:hypothetical protein
VTSTQLIVASIVIGFFAVPFLAGGAPEIVNGILILLIVGALLLNSDVWLPYLAQLGGSFGPGAQTPNPKSGGAARKA